MEAAKLVDDGPSYVDSMINRQVNPLSYPCPNDAIFEAAFRTIKHAETLKTVNPFGADAVDFGLRVCLHEMLSGKEVDLTECKDIPKNVDAALRQIKDRVSVPRDMPIWSAMKFREALEVTAKRFGDKTGKPIAVSDRYDQNPVPFKK